MVSNVNYFVLLIHTLSIDNRAVELHTKMRKNLTMARERVNVFTYVCGLLISIIFLSLF